ncbi:MAG: sulfite exporter TauE/SafE family protein [Nitrospirae bacterium]|nr:sulfite exporter TauE/SafE family protein [Nitrospirota bacterium]MBI3359141.1 sulfite exporter TauE/SafE family protein [Candidatus Troglogloeales bacterium]MBI3597972.1 sulfite exporter TauE/SafE family protein [Candidatus Troglogloeales bacterium]
MNETDIGTTVLILIAFLAAIINGGLGYGFSSTAVPVALLVYTNKVLNPAIVLIEVVINLYILVIHWKNIKTIFPRVFPIIIGAIPGVLLGALLLSRVDSGWIKLITFSFLLPLVLLQAGGIRRPIHSEKAAGLFFGTGVGFFYSVTTVSGPPLALMLSNQGLVKKEFRAALGIIRLSLSSLTAVSYYYLRFYQPESMGVLATMIPSVVVGIPIGTYIIRKVDPETFRRICMSFDAWFVGFGLSRVLIQLNLLQSPWAYSILALAIFIDGGLLYQYFKQGNRK